MIEYKRKQYNDEEKNKQRKILTIASNTTRSNRCNEIKSIRNQL